MKPKMKQILKSIFKHSPNFVKKFSCTIISKYKLSKIKSLNTPTSIVFFITKKCNAKCKHCFYWKEINTKESELNLKEIKEISKSLKHIPKINLTGGEPFLRKDLVEVCKIFYGVGVRDLGLSTNGIASEQIYSLCKEILEQCPNSLFGIQISLDGLEKTHNKVRGISAFNKVVKTIKMLKELKKGYPNLNLVTSTTIFNENYNEVENLINYTKKLGVEHKFSIIRGSHFGVYGLEENIRSNFDPKENKVLISMSKLNQAYKKIKNSNVISKFQKLKFKYMLKILGGKKVLECYAGKVDGVIYSNGDVSFCEMTKPIGNLRDYNFNLEKLWNSDKANLMRQKIKNCYCTHGCNIVNAMRLDKKALLDYFGGKI
jgi:MoaA/NifB/PqqE/SkfB family radical SAM enzyme